MPLDNNVARPHVIQPNCPLLRTITRQDVLQAFKNIGTAKAVGHDGIPAEFITKAFLPVTASSATDDPNSHEHLFAEVLVMMFNSVVATTHMPQTWKVKCIKPLHKAGDRTNCANYRPLAIANTLYRLLSNILSTRLTAFVHARSIMPAQDPMLLHTQFAFRPGHSVDHAHLVLATCCDSPL
jgi:hypothetical protein